jgi:hypothetical protein
MLRAIWSRIMLMLFGRSIGLNDQERSEEMERLRRDHPEMFRENT